MVHYLNLDHYNTVVKSKLKLRTVMTFKINSVFLRLNFFHRIDSWSVGCKVKGLYSLLLRPSSNKQLFVRNVKTNT